MSSGPETLLVGRMQKAIKRVYPSAWIFKVFGGGSHQRVGVPDLLVVVQGRLIALEVKAQGPTESDLHARERATPTQLATLEALARAGAVGGVVLTVEEALGLIEIALRPRP